MSNIYLGNRKVSKMSILEKLELSVKFQKPNSIFLSNFVRLAYTTGNFLTFGMVDNYFSKKARENLEKESLKKICSTFRVIHAVTRMLNSIKKSNTEKELLDTAEWDKEEKPALEKQESSKGEEFRYTETKSTSTNDMIVTTKEIHPIKRGGSLEI